MTHSHAARAGCLLIGLWLLGCAGDERKSPTTKSPAESPATATAPGQPSPTPDKPTPPTPPADPAPDPDAVSKASEPYEPGPSVIATESVDGAALRERTRARLRKDRKPVTLLVGDTPMALGKKLCEQVVPRVPAEVPVLLKPNIGGFAWFKSKKKHPGDNGVRGRTTDPEFVRGIVRCLKDRGHTRITIADGWSAESKYWQRLARVSGYQALADEEGVALVALNDDGTFDVQGQKPGQPLAISGMEKTSVPTLLMPRILAEHLDRGLFISVPKLKTHRFSVVSVAVKGMQGTVMYSDKSPAYRQKWRSHRELSPYMKALKKNPASEDRAAYVAALEVFAERMVDVLLVEAPHVVLAEGAPAMGGDGFHKLTPSAEKVAIGGTNPILVDRVGAQFMGLWDNAELARELGGHRTSPLITAAARRVGLELDAVDVIGNGASLLDEKRPAHLIAMAPFVIDSRASADASGSGAPADSSSDSSADSSTPVAEQIDGKPVARAVAAGAAEMALDGRADEAVWARARPVVWDTDYAGRATGITTRARFAWSSSALYAFFEVEDTGLFVDTSRPSDVEREGLYKEDCVEIFLVPDAERRRHYYEIEVGPYGHWFDLDIDRYKKRGRSNAAWSSGVRVGTTRDPERKRATIEIAMTGPEIVALMRADARLPMGLYRMEGKKPRNYLAWSPPRTPKPKFHVPEAFGTLVLER